MSSVWRVFSCDCCLKILRGHQTKSFMIDQSEYIYYFVYAVASVIAIVICIKVQSMESIVITTSDFKLFQSNFLSAYMLMIFGEVFSVASFYHMMNVSGLTLSQTADLYIVTILSSSVFGLILEIVDFGSKREKCIASAILYALSTASLYFGDYFEILLIGRIINGVASSLLHTSFDAYLVQEHNSQGFPDDWLFQTFGKLPHYMTAVAILCGTIQSVAQRFAHFC
jgi:hypothetical protein